MEISLTTMLIVIGLGVVQLAAGVVIGRCWPLGKWGSARAEASDARRLRDLVRQLFGVVDTVADDVGQHQTRIKEVNHQLTSARAEDAGLAGMVLKAVAQIVNINQRLQSRLTDAEQRLQDQARQLESHVTAARTDPLTGLPNRRAFDDDLLRLLAQWKRKKTPFCLIMIDVDHFKAMNDCFGHPVGDRVLRHLAGILKHTLWDRGLVARIGGEEFAAILPGPDTLNAQQTAERIRAAVASTYCHSGQYQVHVTISLGVATVQPDDDYAALLRRADQALYTSKHAGRNCGHFHNGQACERISLPADPENRQAPPDPEAGAGRNPDVPCHADLESLYDDLRARLAEVTDQP